MTLLKTNTTTHCYWKVVLVVTNKTHFFYLYIPVVDHKFITGIYHKVDDFNFEVISYPFPQSNVHSMVGYSTYYSQLIRFFRLCNNINDFLFRAKFSYSKLVKCGYKHSLLLKYFKRYCSAFNVEGKYGEKNSDLLFSRILKHNPSVSYNINKIKEINYIVKSSYVKIMPLTRSLECEWTNKSPLPTNVFDTVNLSLVMCYMFHLLIPLLCKTWFYKDCNRNCKNPVLGVIRTLGTSNQAIYDNLLNIYSLR